ATGGDMCLDGLCNEVSMSCYAADNGSCDRCADGAPSADAGSSVTAVPNTSVPLTGNGTDPMGQPLTYSWSVVSRPSGSTSQIANSTAQNTTLLVDLAGTYEVCLTVTDTDGCASAEDCVTLTV